MTKPVTLIGYNLFRLVCDTCSAESRFASVDEATARTYGSGHGWKIQPDLCPRCAGGATP